MYKRQDSGSISVLGFNPTKEADELQEKIGIQLQTTSIQPNIRIKEALKLFASFYERPLANPEELLKLLSLEDKAGSRFSKLSGGQQQRVAIALALVNNPSVLFLSNLFMPIDIFPGWLQPICRVLRLTPMNILLRDIVYGAPLDELWQLGVMAGWLAVGIIITVRFFRWE